MGMTELQDEAIIVWTMALLEAHVAAFTSMWHSKPTLGDGEPHTPPKQPPPSEHHVISILSWVTSMTTSSDSSYKISHRRLHSVN